MQRNTTYMLSGAGRSPVAWMILGGLAVVAIWLAFEATVAVATAQPEPADVGSASTQSVLAVAGQVTRDAYGLYLVDTDRRTICIYQWVPKTRKLHLMAARTYTYDRELDEYNTEPSPTEIRDLVKRVRRLEDATTRPR